MNWVMTLTLPPEAYLWFKTLHIVGVVVWFAGLFYLVRLFIYHVEAEEEESPVREAFKAQYAVMERRLANIITTPGLILTVTDGSRALDRAAVLAAPRLDARKARFCGAVIGLSRVLLSTDGPTSGWGLPMERSATPSSQRTAHAAVGLGGDAGGV
jgi:uncharacterized membrane protein